MKFMVNVKTFMLAQLEHLNVCIIQKSHMYITGCAKPDFFVTVMFTARIEWLFLLVA